jgi:tetratricopeptide (TPR) repeat protein
MSPRQAFLLAIVACFLALPTWAASADVQTLRAQLVLATDDKDTLSRIELLRRILDADPADATSHRLLIELWLEINDYDLAAATLDAWPEAPADLAALTRASVLRNRDEDVPGAIRVLREFLAKEPTNLPANQALVSALLTTDDLRAQLAALDALLALTPRDVTGLIQRANVKLKLADYPGALADAGQAQALEPDNDTVKSALPAFERLQEALQTLPPLDAALKKNPQDLAKLVERAWWLRYGSILDRSLADANAALAVDPDSLAAKITRARALYLLGKLKAEDSLKDESIDATKANAVEDTIAIAAADLALAKNSNDAAQLTARAHALNATEQFLLAQRDAEAAMALQPAVDQATAAGLEDLYATTMLGQDPAAIFRRIEALKPPKPMLALANAHLADLYFRQAKLPLALEFADRALALDETIPVLRVKAATLKRLGRPDDAAIASKRADALEAKK